MTNHEWVLHLWASSGRGWERIGKEAGVSRRTASNRAHALGFRRTDPMKRWVQGPCIGCMRTHQAEELDNDLLCLDCGVLSDQDMAEQLQATTTAEPLPGGIDLAAERAASRERRRRRLEAGSAEWPSDPRAPVARVHKNARTR